MPLALLAATFYDAPAENEDCGDVVAEISIDLTFDEVELCCSVLGIELPVGIVPDGIEYPEAIGERLRASARASLVARRILATDADGPTVNDAVGALLELSSSPALIASVEVELASETEQHFLLCDPDLGVDVVSITPAAFRFTPFVTRDLVPRVIRISDLRPAETVPVPPVTLTPDELEIAARAAELRSDEASAYLIGLGVDEKSGLALSRALAERRASISVTVLHQPEEDLIEGGTLSWIDAGLCGNWLYEPAAEGAPDDIEKVTLRSLDAKELAAQLVEFLPAAFGDEG
jgi:hypothetical protein